ncbi:MAG: response regulator, partial [Acidobacteria bacterium]|nr:response regulator [Acidobacteriota bacterium]
MPMVLLVDADPDSSVRFEKALRAAGYEVSVAQSGSRALAMLRQRRPDLIISQAAFEDMFGSEFCTAVRSDPATKEIMFVLLVDRASQMAHATQTQADMVLPENLPVSTVVTRIDTHLRLRGVPGLGPP